jgi:O-6-methylguanine DNA methyltransferase
MLIERTVVESQLGPILLVLAEEALHALEFIDCEPSLDCGTTRRRPRREPPPEAHGRPSARAGAVAARVEAYFAGDLDALDAVAIAPAGTPFQLRVWAALRRIPVGQTRSYRDVAIEIGAASAMRAVGAANGRNPISLVVPCHRVIAADGTLHGYGGGLWRKEWLLRHERAIPPGLFDRGDATVLARS